jgi:glycerol uptake facilitator-like aquaporin
MTRAFAAEFIGTTLLLAAVVGSGIMGERLAAGNIAVALLANALATGAALYVLILIFAPVSGAHFNPAVTLAFALRGELSASLAIGYGAAQFLGALAGVALAHLMFGLAIVQLSVTVRTGMDQWSAEVIATLGLVLTILGTINARRDAIPAAVGLYIFSAYWFTSSTSFANPAVTLARSITNTFAGIAPDGVFPFVVAQVVGALLALGVAGFLWPSHTKPKLA